MPAFAGMTAQSSGINIQGGDVILPFAANQGTKSSDLCLESFTLGFCEGILKFIHTADTHLGFEITKIAQSDPLGRQNRADSIFENFVSIVEQAIEIEADAILKGTRVDGVYDRDPEQFDDAIKYENVTYMEVVQKRLRVMDSTAVTLCMDNNLPIVVFNLKTHGNLKRVILGEHIGTKVNGE